MVMKSIKKWFIFGSRVKEEQEQVNDLSPRGIRSTIKGENGFNETFAHIWSQLNNN